MKVNIQVEMPDGQESMTEVMGAIADRIDGGDDDGTVATPSGECRWRCDEISEGIAIDRRQRLAAAILLSGIDLPQPVIPLMQNIREASMVCPGITVNMLPAMNGEGRMVSLRKARDLIDEMLADAEAGVGDGS